MIRLCFVCFFLLGSTGLLAYSTLFTLFQADYAGPSKLTWKATSSSNVQKYAVPRKASTTPAFHMLASLEPTNQRRYRYSDQSAYHGLPTPFPHRLNGHPRAGQVHTSITLSNTPSAVERSWVTIKSMFR